MKILAFADLHCDIKSLERIKQQVKKKKVDLILCAGDISLFGNCLKEVMELLHEMHKPVLMIHGNHETEKEMIKLCKKYDNIIFIHKHTAEIRDIVIMGHGGGGFANRDKEFEMLSKSFSKKMKDKKSILVTHGPPYGTKLDKINGEYAGNKSYTKFINRYKPNIVICGHLHETAGKADKIGNTMLINPGWNGVMFEL